LAILWPSVAALAFFGVDPCIAIQTEYSLSSGREAVLNPGLVIGHNGSKVRDPDAARD
jgi:hypothetical protein